MKDINIKKEKVNLFQFSNGMIIYTENPKESTKKTNKINE